MSPTLIAALLTSASILFSACTKPQTSTLAWERHEAEEGRTNGTLQGPSRTYLTPESEASGRSYVRLEEEGDYVEWVASASADAIVVRFCIPDAPTGGGINSALDVLVNGQPRTQVPLTSRHAWIYGDFPWSNDPKLGRGHRFFDEARQSMGPVAAGDVVRLQVPGNAAAWHLIDLIELEQRPPPLPRPEGSLALTDFGASANDEKDDSPALAAALKEARASGQALWIPPGDFMLNGSRISLPGVRVTGAGMWHSRLVGTGTMFESCGEAVWISDLAIIGEVDRRVDNLPENAFNGNFGQGSLFERLWIERMKCGFWTTFGTRGLVLRDSRLRNLMADGVNFCDGTSDSLVERCHLRNTGDDALATWSPTTADAAGHPCERNAFVENLIELPWLANGIAIYGGRDHNVRGNDIRGTVFSGSGILVSSGFGALELAGKILIEGNRMAGTGGDSHTGERVGGISIQARDSDITASIVIEGNRINDTTGGGFSFHGPRSCGSTIIRNCEVDRAAVGVEIHPNAKGVVRLESLRLRDVRGGMVNNHAGPAFRVLAQDDGGSL
jgi:hypothetical protein